MAPAMVARCARIGTPWATRSGAAGPFTASDRMLLALVHLVIAVIVVEAMALLAWRRAVLVDLAPHLLAGLALSLALRAAVADDGFAAVAAWLAIAGLSHGAALWRSTTRRT
jgi:hypothetical protein